MNLARLEIRAGDSDTGHFLITSLFEAIRTRTDIVIDGITVPAAALTAEPDSHRDLTRWLYGVCLADGSRALTSAGRWTDAEDHLRQRNGIGQCMLDGHQVAVIARLVTGQHQAARQLLTETEPGEPWEPAVTACLTARCRAPNQPLPAAHPDTMIHLYLQLPKNAGTTVFTTRLALSIIDAGDHDQDFVTSVGEQLTRATLDAEDGYAARDVLEHPLSAQMDETRRSALATVLGTSGLDRPLDSTGHRLLTSAVRVAASTITGRQPSAMRALISLREASRGQRPPEHTAAEGHHQ